MASWTLAATACIRLTLAASDPRPAGPEVTIAGVVPVAPVWAGHPVGFCLLTSGDRQYVAYYDAERRMTVAVRDRKSDRWQFQVLPERVGWDSHNSIEMAIDRTGCLHLSGNMHCVPLIYFRTDRPRDISSFRRIEKLVGREEDRCTYPQFVEGPDGALIFTYRIGGSGNGRRIHDIYDAEAKTWRRLLDAPLLDGRGEMNAYPSGPVRGADGRYHLCWMWRDTPDCATNHHISYARSPDLVHWETAGGARIRLPITIETEGVVVDPVPSNRGLINMGHSVGFDAKGRPVVTYHKYDAAGKSQIYNARWEGSVWRIHRTSDWDWRWEFGGGGAVPCLVSAGPIRVLADGTLAQTYHNRKYGSGRWRLDPETLKPAGEVPPEFPIPRDLRRVESDFPGMQVRMSADEGQEGDPDVRYTLRWETLPVNRDRPRSGPLPEPSMLRVYELIRRTR
ncbi:MAG: BNR repeat-containing protein [Planctomycetes bacterium]|nr:BNR repeat-containing protein [Planctomycetota bacterium]